MSKFGWSLPPGVTELPGEVEGDLHPKSEEMYDLLEKSGVAQGVIDAACAIVDELADTVECLSNQECDYCERRRAEDERKAYEDFKNDPLAEDKQEPKTGETT